MFRAAAVAALFAAACATAAPRSDAWRGRPPVRGPCAPLNGLVDVAFDRIRPENADTVRAFVKQARDGDLAAGAKAAGNALRALAGDAPALEAALIVYGAWMSGADGLTQAFGVGTYTALRDALLAAEPGNLTANVTLAVMLVRAPTAAGGDPKAGRSMLEAMAAEQPEHSGVLYGLLADAVNREDRAAARTYADRYNAVCPNDRSQIEPFLLWLEEDAAGRTPVLHYAYAPWPRSRLGAGYPWYDPYSAWGPGWGPGWGNPWGPYGAWGPGWGAWGPYSRGWGRPYAPHGPAPMHTPAQPYLWRGAPGGRRR